MNKTSARALPVIVEAIERARKIYPKSYDVGLDVVASLEDAGYRIVSAPKKKGS